MKMNNLVEWFQLEYPELVKDMHDCSHHGENVNPYHQEGSIFCHTMMVCKQAENASYEVQIAALLHDIGKPSTRKINPKNGNVSFYNHDAVSAFMSLEILKREELGLRKEQQIRIFNMIALHTQIYKLSLEQLAAIGDETLINNLIKLGEADHSGRFHTKGEAEIPLPILVWNKMEPKRSTKKLEKEVIVLCGLPGSGKSTWVDENYGGTSENFSVISRDSFIEAQKGDSYNEKWKNTNQKEADRFLQERFNDVNKFPTVTTIVDMTHMSKKSRRRSLSHFGPEYKKKCVVFLTDLEKNFLQNENRCGKIIKKEVIDRMMRSFYPPTFEEFDEIEYVI